jgi:uncharacterized membrane protein
MRERAFVRGALIAALYFVLSLPWLQISYGQFQVRISEVLTILPFFFPEAIFGLTVGCILTNLYSPFGIIDVVFGSLCTLTASYLTFYLHNFKKPYLGIIPPILINAFGVGLYVSILTNEPKVFNLYRYLFFATTIGVGEIISAGIGGSLLITYFIKRKSVLKLLHLLLRLILSLVILKEISKSI